MQILEETKKEIVEKLNKVLGADIILVSDLEYPPNPEMGDLSLPCFKIAKEMSKSPAAVAMEISSGTGELSSVVAGMSTAGPYLNIKLKTDALAVGLFKEIKKQKKKYGENKNGRKKKVMLEYSNGNTHKECHIGHVRNIAYGDAVNRIVSANGYRSIPVSYINDFGIHVAKTLWGYNEFYKETDIPDNKGEFLGQVYVRASKESKDNAIAKGMIEGMMKKIETREGEEYELWQKTRQWSIEQFSGIYKELGVEFKGTFYESEYIDEGRKLVNKLIKEGILKESQGAVIADLEKYDLGVLVIQRSDGTATYPVADIPLAMAKLKKFDPAVSIYVVDVRQALYFNQLFKIFELMGYKQEFKHLGYEFVKLPSGMMASRTGNIVTYEELKKEIFKKAKSETKERHQDWSEERVNEVAWSLTVGAMKFEMLKVGATQEITFDINKALEFSGYTAAYLQYTYARINSILKKADGGSLPTPPLRGTPPREGNLNCEFTEPKEHELIIKMAKYPEAVERAGREYNPSEVAKYLFELAQAYNDFYHSVPVLKADDGIREARLALCLGVAQVLENGLELLGIKIIKEM